MITSTRNCLKDVYSVTHDITWTSTVVGGGVCVCVCVCGGGGGGGGVVCVCVCVGGGGGGGGGYKTVKDHTKMFVQTAVTATLRVSPSILQEVNQWISPL